MTVLPFGGLWYTEDSDAVEYAKFYSRLHDAAIRVYVEAGKVVETHQHAGEYQSSGSNSTSLTTHLGVFPV
jgi:hypothetical protein